VAVLMKITSAFLTDVMNKIDRAKKKVLLSGSTYEKNNEYIIISKEFF
jgi:hypothetical protein